MAITEAKSVTKLCTASRRNTTGRTGILKVRAGVQVDPKILSRYVGTYQLGPDFDLIITVDNGQMIAQASGQPKFSLHAESETRFFPLEFPAELEFAKDAKGAVSGLVLHQGGAGQAFPNPSCRTVGNPSITGPNRLDGSPDADSTIDGVGDPTLASNHYRF